MNVRYRLLARPGRGPAPDNYVHLGLAVVYENQFGPVLFEGAPVQIVAIKNVMEGVPLVGGGGRFGFDRPTNLRELASIMSAQALRPHEPVLIDGAEIFGRLKPLNLEVYDLPALAELLAQLCAHHLDLAWSAEEYPDGSREGNVKFILRVWKAWRAVKSAGELAHELEILLPRMLGKWVPDIAERIVAWPRDADRVPAIARIVAEVFEEHSEPRALFEALQERLRR